MLTASRIENRTITIHASVVSSLQLNREAKAMACSSGIDGARELTMFRIIEEQEQQLRLAEHRLLDLLNELRELGTTLPIEPSRN